MEEWIPLSIGARLAGIFIVIALPYLHIGIFHLKIWVPNKKPVDRSSCKCDCFDTVFKGTYQEQKNVGYKHVYFNATLQTFVIWIITAISLVLAYELIKYLLKLIYKKQIRMSMLILVAFDIYPHYYSWWNYFNYINDGFYKQFVHQMFFSVTEFISTVVIVTLCSTQNEVTKSRVMIVVSISTIHILIGSIDQFFVQIFLLQGKLFQKIRNVGFLIPDILHVVLPIWLYKQTVKSKVSMFDHLYCGEFNSKDLLKFSATVLAGTVLGKVILR